MSQVEEETRRELVTLLAVLLGQLGVGEQAEHVAGEVAKALPILVAGATLAPVAVAAGGGGDGREPTAAARLRSG